MKSSGIGGQAVIEGVMMKNGDQYAVAVRTPDGKIEVDKKACKSYADSHAWARLPLIRGVVTFAESMSVGMKTLTYSASFYEEEEEQKESKIEKAFSSIFKEKAETIVMGLTVVIAIMVAIGLFMFLPWIVAEKLGTIIKNNMLQAAVEGLIRLVIFVVYVLAISMTKDIRRVYMYHGAEHKTINCVEQGLELTVDNVRKQSREHKRCGTSFMLYVVIISIVLFMFIRVDSDALRIVLRVVLVPVIAGISYEYIRFMGNHDGLLVKILSKPGFWMQGLTTREPDDSMIEVAIASVEAVFDWKGYIEAVQNGKVDEFLKGQTPVMVRMDGEEPKKEKVVSASTSKLEDEDKTPRVAAVKRADTNVRHSEYFHDPGRYEEDSLAALDHKMTEESEPAEELSEAESSLDSACSADMIEVLSSACETDTDDTFGIEASVTEEKSVFLNENMDASDLESEKATEVKKVELDKKAVQTSHVAAIKKAAGVRRPMQPIEELRRESILIDAEEEDDEILSALDKFFDE